LSKLLSPCGHTDQLPNLLAEQLFSMANEALIKAEGSFNLREPRSSSRLVSSAAESFPVSAASA
jgi:hypothetical protein